MSLESALDEDMREMREVAALKEGRPAQGRSARPASPAVYARTRSPPTAASPARNMLDIADSPGARSSSISRGGANPSSPPPAIARILAGSSSPSRNPESANKFETFPSIEANSMSKRVTQGGKKGSAGDKPRAMSSVYGADSTRHGSISAFLGNQNSKSGSPGPGRSQSPGGRKLNTNFTNQKSTSGKYATDSGAHRRMSDGAVLQSGGGLSHVPVRKGSNPVKGEASALGGGVRLATDDYVDDEDEAAVESSDNDDPDDWDDGWGDSKERGRRRTRRSSSSGQKAPVITAKSLLAAAEEARKDDAYPNTVFQASSLLEPSVTVTGPDGAILLGEKLAHKKHGVHPHTSFDQGGLSSAYTSDAEADLSEIKSAQQLAMSISPVQSSPDAHRCVRQVLRGDYGKFQNDAEDGLRRQRVYLVATDLSDEAAYALEWTIGTVLRDGDTLLAVYAVDEETGIGGTDPSEGATTALQESNALKKTLQNHGSLSAGGPGSSPLANSLAASEADIDSMNKAEKARYQAAVEVSDRCIKLLRKTRLQIRIVVEVFHCKSPKHMITEVIDFLEPTLVILGSRGRNALKGNYLVTKSSVPVMVARKRLRKHSKYKRKNLRLSNVISSPNGKLANAKID